MELNTVNGNRFSSSLELGTITWTSILTTMEAHRTSINTWRKL